MQENQIEPILSAQDIDLTGHGSHEKESPRADSATGRLSWYYKELQYLRGELNSQENNHKKELNSLERKYEILAENSKREKLDLQKQWLSVVPVLKTQVGFLKSQLTKMIHELRHRGFYSEKIRQIVDELEHQPGLQPGITRNYGLRNSISQLHKDASPVNSPRCLLSENAKDNLNNCEGHISLNSNPLSNVLEKQLLEGQASTDFLEEVAAFHRVCDEFLEDFKTRELIKVLTVAVCIPQNESNNELHTPQHSMKADVKPLSDLDRINLSAKNQDVVSQQDATPQSVQNHFEEMSINLSDASTKSCQSTRNPFQPEEVVDIFSKFRLTLLNSQRSEVLLRNKCDVVCSLCGNIIASQVFPQHILTCCFRNEASSPANTSFCKRFVKRVFSFVSPVSTSCLDSSLDKKDRLLLCRQLFKRDMEIVERLKINVCRNKTRNTEPIDHSHCIEILCNTNPPIHLKKYRNMESLITFHRLLVDEMPKSIINHLKWFPDEQTHSMYLHRRSFSCDAADLSASCHQVETYLTMLFKIRRVRASPLVRSFFDLPSHILI